MLDTGGFRVFLCMATD